MTGRLGAEAAGSVEDTAEAPSTLRWPRRFVADLIKRGLWGEQARSRSAIPIEAVFIVAYIALRVADASPTLILAWTLATAALALVAPVSGLVVLAAIGPFSDPLRGISTLRAVPIIVAAIGVGVAAGQLVGISRESLRAWLRPPIVAAAALALTTLAGVGYTALRFGGPAGATSFRQWAFRIGTAMVVVAVAYWAARRGERRPFLMLIGSAALAGLLSIADFLRPDLFARGPFDWLLAPGRNRLAGVIPVATGGASNALAALMLVPAAVLGAFALWAREPRRRVVAATFAAILLVGVYLTYSRSALLAIAVIAVVVAWRFRPRLGLALLVLVFVAGVVAVPLYLQSRGQALGGRAVPIAGSVLTSSDNARLRAWTTAVRMWADSPVVGQGYGSWARVRRAYGVRRLPNAHNELLMLLAEGGLLAGAAGLAFVGAAFRELWRRRGWLLTGVVGAFAAYCVAASFNGLLGFMQLTIVAFGALGFGLGDAQRQRDGPDEDVSDGAGPAAAGVTSE